MVRTDVKIRTQHALLMNVLCEGFELARKRFWNVKIRSNSTGASRWVVCSNFLEEICLEISTETWNLMCFISACMIYINGESLRCYNCTQFWQSRGYRTRAMFGILYAALATNRPSGILSAWMEFLPSLTLVRRMRQLSRQSRWEGPWLMFWNQSHRLKGKNENCVVYAEPRVKREKGI